MSSKKRLTKSLSPRQRKLSLEREKRRLERKIKAHGPTSQEAAKQIERVKRLSAEMKVMKGV